MSTRYVFRRTTTVTVVMADPGEVDPDGEPGPATAQERDESAREWAEQALPLDDYGEDFVTVEHGPVELVGQVSESQPEPVIVVEGGGDRLAALRAAARLVGPDVLAVTPEDIAEIRGKSQPEPGK